MANNLTGQCLCGSVSFQCPDEFLYGAFCHCRDCQRATGGFYGVFVGIEMKKLKWISGESSLRRFEKSQDTIKHFCQHCGVGLIAQKPQLDLVHIPYGLFDNAPSQKPQVHLFTTRLHNYHCIEDELPQYKEGLV